MCVTHMLLFEVFAFSHVLQLYCFQEFGLARFKTSATKTMKGFEYILAKMQGNTLYVY